MTDRQTASGTGVLAGRNLALDVLRAGSIFIVLGRHLWSFGPADNNLFRSGVALWQRGGWVGVDLFFVLSGFLISGLLFSEYQKHGAISIRRFYLRRGLKIYPAFFAFLAITLAIKWFAFGDWPSKTYLCSEVLFLQSYFGGFWGHTWSLAVEEHFYICLPLLLVVMLARGRGRRDPFRPILYLFAALAVTTLAMRIHAGLAVPYKYMRHHIPTHLRIDSLMFGVLLSYLYRFHRPLMDRAMRGRAAVALIAGLAMLSPAFLFDIFTYDWVSTVGYSLFWLASGLILMGLIYLRLPVNRITRTTARIGAHSYSIYLWHMPVALWVMPPLLRAWPGLPLGLGIAMYVSLSLALGIAMAVLLEQPVIRLRDRLFPSRSRAIESTTDTPQTPQPLPTPCPTKRAA